MYTEKQLLRALKRLNDNWPREFWIFAASGTFTLMRTDENGHHAHKGEGYDPDFIEQSYMNIDCDGGDW